MPHVDLVALLDADDTRLHVGTPGEVIPHLEVTAETVDETNEKFEFYDALGNKLVLTAEDGTIDFVQNGKEDPQLVTDRIALVLARNQVRLTRTPSALFEGRLPVVSASLPITLAAVAGLFGPLGNPQRGVPPPDNGDDYHTWCHSEGIAH